MPKSHSEPNDTQVAPEPALEKHTRGQSTPEYKLRIIVEADACHYGELGVILRREKLYSNQLAAWRGEFAQGGLAGLSKSTLDPASSKSLAERRIEQLEKENGRLRRKLDIANDCLDFQKSHGDARSFTQWERCVNTVYALHSTTIDLRLSPFLWVQFRSTKSRHQNPYAVGPAGLYFQLYSCVRRQAT